MQRHYARLFSFCPRGHCTYLVMLNTYNYVVLGWDTTSTSFFTLLKINLLGLGFGPVDKHVADIAQEHVTDNAQKHVADIAQKRKELQYLTYMSEMT